MCRKSNTDGLDPNLPVLKGEKCESRLAKLWIDIMKSVCAKLKSSDKEPTHPTPNSGKAKSHHAKLRTNNNEPKDDTSRSGKSGSTRPMPNKGGTESRGQAAESRNTQLLQVETTSQVERKIEATAVAQYDLHP